MSPLSNREKFKKHLKEGGMFYAFWRGVKYFAYLVRKPFYKKKQPAKRKRPRKAFLASSYVVIKDNLKLIYADNGIRVFWKGKELTVSPGLNTAINTLGLWTNSSKAKWSLLLKSQFSFKIEIVYGEIPLTQFWYVKAENQHEISWHTHIMAEEWMHINEIRLLAMLNSNYKAWFSDYQHEDFPSLDDLWHDIYLDNRQVSIIGARFSRGDVTMPSFSMEASVDTFLPLVQNPPLNNRAHLLGLRIMHLMNKNNFERGIYPLFSGKINIIDNNVSLDKKIEVVRKRHLNKVMNKDYNGGA